MKTFTETIEVSTNGKPEYIDITDKAKKIVEKSGIKSGIVVVFLMHTSCGIVIQEKCDALLQDFWDMYDKMAPKEPDDLHKPDSKRFYHHPDPNSPLRQKDPNYMYLNGHSHLRAYFLTPSITFPVIDGKMHMSWTQTLFFVELDETRVRTRKITVHVIGE